MKPTNKYTNTVRIESKQYQKGITMLTSLAFILVIAMMGSVAMDRVFLNTKIGSVAKNRYIAFSDAESALNVAAGFFKNPNVRPECLYDGFLNTVQKNKWWLNWNWEDRNTFKADQLMGSKQQKKIVVDAPIVGVSPYAFESLSHTNKIAYHYYRVTTRGTTSSDSIHSMTNSNRTKRHRTSTVYLQGIYIMKQYKNTSCS